MGKEFEKYEYKLKLELKDFVTLRLVNIQTNHNCRGEFRQLFLQLTMTQDFLETPWDSS